MIEALSILLFSLIFLLGLIYISTVNMVGHEVALRQTLEILTIFLFLPPIFLLSYSLKDYGLATLQALVSVIIFISLLSSPFRKKQSGILLLDIGRSEVWAASLLLGLGWLGTTVSNTLSFFNHISTGFPQDTNLATEVSKLACYGSFSIFWILLALSKTEFRKNGIWLGIRLIKWQRIKSYKWESSKPNILTIRYKPSFPFFFGWMSLPIPPQSREDVSHILNERLPNESL
jgi:hypothetical protein